jgi:paraquat-inducible protein B
MSETEQTPKRVEDLPKARIKTNWRSHIFWLIPIAAAVLAGYFIYNEVIKGGPTVTVLFENAAGLQPGKSQVKYRGVEVGLVEDIELTDDNKHVRVTVALHSTGENMAKEGSRWWIVEPHVGLTEIKGLGTVVSGDFIAVEPGTGKEQTNFIGLNEQAPPAPEEHGLRIKLVLERMGSLKKHSPIMYRGVEVGEVWDAMIGPDSQVIYVTALIKKGYAPLVRMNSKFWNAGGINFKLGLSGLELSAQSVQTLVTGGIDFATPDPPGEQAIQDTAFTLYEKPEQAWLSWAPRIKLPRRESAIPPVNPGEPQ